MRVLLLFAVAALLLASCGGNDNQTVSGNPPESSKRLDVSSPHFANGRRIPLRYTCDGADVSPALRWRGVPSGAAEVAILVEDPDAPGGIFVHWTAWGISPKLRGIADNPDPSAFQQGKNSFGKLGYSGPCPPKGEMPHHYEFHVYALRHPLGLKDGAEPQTVRQTIEAIVDAGGTLTGVYGR